MTRGVLDRFLKNQRSPKQREAKALDWLKSFRAEVEGA